MLTVLLWPPDEVENSWASKKCPSVAFQVFWSADWVSVPRKSQISCKCPFVVESVSHVWPCDPMDCSTPGSPVLHCLLELAQIHVHWVSHAIQPSHPLLPSSPPALNLSEHQGLFQWVGSSHHVTKVLELQLPVMTWKIMENGLSILGLDSFYCKRNRRCWMTSHIPSPPLIMILRWKFPSTGCLKKSWCM